MSDGTDALSTVIVEMRTWAAAINDLALSADYSAREASIMLPGARHATEWADELAAVLAALSATPPAGGADALARLKGMAISLRRQAAMMLWEPTHDRMMGEAEAIEALCTFLAAVTKERDEWQRLANQSSERHRRVGDQLAVAIDSREEVTAERDEWHGRFLAMQSDLAAADTETARLTAQRDEAQQSQLTALRQVRDELVRSLDVERATRSLLSGQLTALRGSIERDMALPPLAAALSAAPSQPAPCPFCAALRGALSELNREALRRCPTYGEQEWDWLLGEIATLSTSPLPATRRVVARPATPGPFYADDVICDDVAPSLVAFPNCPTCEGIVRGKMPDGNLCADRYHDVGTILVAASHERKDKP